MRDPPLELHVERAAVSDMDDDGVALINCQTASGQQVLLRLTRETLVLLHSGAAKQLRRYERKVGRSVKRPGIPQQ